MKRFFLSASVMFLMLLFSCYSYIAANAFTHTCCMHFSTLTAFVNTVINTQSLPEMLGTKSILVFRFFWGDF